MANNASGQVRSEELHDIINDDSLGRDTDDGIVPRNTPCKYYTLRNIHELDVGNANNFSILNLNIQSQNAHESDLECFLDSFDADRNLSVISISETWATTHTASSFDFAGYSLYYSVRPCNSGRGGVNLYINNKFKHRERKDLHLSTSHMDCESVFVDLWDETGTFHAIVGSLYRPPSGNLDNFLTALDDTLKKVNIT